MIGRSGGWSPSPGGAVLPPAASGLEGSGPASIGAGAPPEPEPPESGEGDPPADASGAGAGAAVSRPASAPTAPGPLVPGGLQAATRTSAETTRAARRRDISNFLSFPPSRDRPGTEALL